MKQKLLIFLLIFTFLLTFQLVPAMSRTATYSLHSKNAVVNLKTIPPAKLVVELTFYDSKKKTKVFPISDQLAKAFDAALQAEILDEAKLNDAIEKFEDECTKAQSKSSQKDIDTAVNKAFTSLTKTWNKILKKKGDEQFAQAKIQKWADSAIKAVRAGINPTTGKKDSKLKVSSKDPFYSVVVTAVAKPVAADVFVLNDNFGGGTSVTAAGDGEDIEIELKWILCDADYPALDEPDAKKMVAEFTITIPSDIESNVYEVIWRHLGDLRSLHGKKFTEIVSRYDKEITAQDGNKTNISKLIKELNKEFASAVKTLEQAVIEQIKKDYSAHAKRRKDYKIGIAMDSFKAVFNVGKAVTGIVLKPADPFAWVGLANSLYKTFKSIEKYTQAIDTARADMDEILKTVKDELAKSSPESSKLKKAVAKSRSAIKDYNKKIKQLDDKIDKEFGVMRANLYVINNQMVKDPDFKDVAGEFSKLFDSIVTLNQGLLNHQNNAFDAMDIVDNVNDFLGRTDDGAFKTFLKDRIALFQATDLLPLLPMVQFIPGAEAAGKTTGKVLTVIKAAENLVDVAEKLTKKKK